MQALPLLQHYLQLCEAHFEPDGVEVAAAFAEIAEAYSHVGRFGYLSKWLSNYSINEDSESVYFVIPLHRASEEYYYQALAILEANPEVSSTQVLKVLCNPI